MKEKLYNIFKASKQTDKKYKEYLCNKLDDQFFFINYDKALDT